MIRTWKAASLRTQLMTLMTVLMVVIVGLTGLVTISLLRFYLTDRLDADIYNNRQQVSDYVVGISSPGPASNNSLLRFYGLLMDRSGNPLRATALPSGTVDVPKIRPMSVAEVQSLGARAFDAPGTLHPGEDWRVRVFALQDGSGSIAVALSMSSVNETVDQAAVLIYTVGFLATALASLIAYMAITRSFRPLRRVEKTAAAIAGGDLSRRVEVENPSTEVGRLSRSLNAMLAHIESAFAARTASEAKMRRFVADASHELRTPLVTIRGFSELYRHGALQTEEDVAAAMGRIESEAKRMGNLVEDLLMLARIDEQRPLEAKPVDLLQLANDAALDARASAPDRVITVLGLDGGPAGSAPTVGDEGRLRQVLANLLTNALRYTPKGTPIELAVGVRPVIEGRSDSIIEVRDHGPGISEQDAARVFERFYRADTSRTRETGGTGLGLAIVSALVAQHGGTVRLDATEGGGATFSVRLPYSQVPDPHDAGEAPEGRRSHSQQRLG